MTVGLIPSRMGSQRLPGKALALIENIPVVVHVAKRAQFAKQLESVIVCTDSVEIINACNEYEIQTIKTGEHFRNGTERIASVAKELNAELYIDIQGDEPLVDPEHIDKVATYLSKNKDKCDIVIPTLEVPYSSPDTIVRVQTSTTNRVMTLSKSMIPHRYRETTPVIKTLINNRVY